MRILIAEDEAAFRGILQKLLSEWGYQVEVAEDGEQAYRALSAEDPPRLAVLDWKMPGLEGVEICRRLRRERAAPYTYVILITSQQRDEDLVQGMEAGADDYLVKPIKLNEFRVRLRAGRRIVELQEELLAARAVLQEKATHDSLTGLNNRERILEILECELAREARDRGCFSVIMADIDHFKQINDRYGHLTGDTVLRQIARTMLGHLRPYDSIGRYGGEEFLMVLPECCGECALGLAERLRNSVADGGIDTPEGVIPATVSLGVASAGRGCSQTAEEILAAADAALYQAKERGRNRVEVASGPWDLPGEPGPSAPSGEGAAPPQHAASPQRGDLPSFLENTELGQRLTNLEIAAFEGGHFQAETLDAREFAETILETVREPLLVLSSESRVLMASRAFYHTFDLSPEATLGSSIYALGRGSWDHPRLRALLEEILPSQEVPEEYRVVLETVGAARKTLQLKGRQIFQKSIGSYLVLLSLQEVPEGIGE